VDIQWEACQVPGQEKGPGARAPGPHL